MPFAKFLFLLAAYILNLEARAQAHLDRNFYEFINHKSSHDTLIKNSFYLSVIWEGLHLKADNLETLKLMRIDFPNMPIIHFIDPAYFAHNGTDEQRIKNLINSTLKKEDRICLHNHSWNGLLQQSGVTPRYDSSYWGQKINANLCEKRACGHEVPLTIYSKAELRKIIQHSLALMQKHFNITPNCYMAGAWLMSKDLLDVLIELNFKYDFSYTKLELLQKRLKPYPLYQMIQNSWLDYEQAKVPRIVHRPSGWLFEIGVNAASLDYHSSDELKKLFNTHFEGIKTNTNLHPFHFSLYQESFRSHYTRLKEILNDIHNRFGKLPNNKEELDLLDLVFQN